jgi:hypothetical protein
VGALLSSLKSGKEPLDIFLDFESQYCVASVHHRARVVPTTAQSQPLLVVSFEEEKNCKKKKLFFAFPCANQFRAGRRLTAVGI